MRTAQGDEGLYEGEGKGGEAEDGMGVGHDEHDQTNIMSSLCQMNH